MTSPWSSQERTWEELVAGRLREDGYEVFVEPSADELPFDLGGYRPDLVARRDNEGLIIELKRTEQRLSIDRYVDAAALIRQHAGWRFILIPTERLEETGLQTLLRVPSRGELANQAEAASLLIERQLFSAAFVTAWSGIEGVLRLIAAENAIPVSALSPVALVKHLYSQGLLSRAQFDALQRLVEVRNRVIHGFAEPQIAEVAPVTLGLLLELLSVAPPSRPAI